MEDLLFIELCERISFGVRVILRSELKVVKSKYEQGEDISDDVYDVTEIYPTTRQITITRYDTYVSIKADISQIVLCLRHKHDMDKKEIDGALLELQTSAISAYNYYKKNHIDINGLIKRGCALEVKREFYFKD